MHDSPRPGPSSLHVPWLQLSSAQVSVALSQRSPSPRSAWQTPQDPKPPLQCPDAHWTPAEHAAPGAPVPDRSWPGKKRSPTSPEHLGLLESSPHFHALSSEAHVSTSRAVSVEPDDVTRPTQEATVAARGDSASTQEK